VQQHNPVTAQRFHYHEHHTQEIIEEIIRNPEGYVNAYNDVFTGSAYLDAVHDARIKPDDILLILSIDDAQLYESKSSDCWIYIWIILEFSPKERYKKKSVLSSTIIPRPNKLKFIESFLYPGFHHISTLQHEGLPVWDTSSNHFFTSHLFLFLTCADGPGLLCLSGLIGHSGKHGCRMYCPIKGQHKPRRSQYYPILLLPMQYNIDGCAHPDIDPRSITPGTSEQYVMKLKYLMSSQTKTQYKKHRLDTGIVAPSFLLDLQLHLILGIPKCFSSEIMHFSGANMASLFMDLWHGMMNCDELTDNQNSWDWRVLVNERWSSCCKLQTIPS